MISSKAMLGTEIKSKLERHRKRGRERHRQRDRETEGRAGDQEILRETERCRDRENGRERNRVIYLLYSH